jgi:hypothetical protein
MSARCASVIAAPRRAASISSIVPASSPKPVFTPVSAQTVEVCSSIANHVAVTA